MDNETVEQTIPMTQDPRQNKPVDAFTIDEGITKNNAAQVAAMDDIIKRVQESAPNNSDIVASTLETLLVDASPEDAALLKAALLQWKDKGKMPISPDDELVENWRVAVYPYKNRMSRKNYEKQKYQLQVELLKLQAWVRETGQRVVILFEGRDAAGKGGTIKRFMEHLNPRGARVVALEKPTETERGHVTFLSYRQRAKSSCLTALGTTVRVWNV
jgi:hypothetical protein